MVDPLVATTVAPLEATVAPLDAVEVVLVSQAVPIQVATQHSEATHAVHLVVLVQRHLLLHATTTLPEIITLLHRVILTTVAHLEVAVAAVVAVAVVAPVAAAAEASVVAAAIVAAVIDNK